MGWGLRTKKKFIMGVYKKSDFSGGEVHKKQYIEGIA